MTRILAGIVLTIGCALSGLGVGVVLAITTQNLSEAGFAAGAVLLFFGACGAIAGIVPAVILMFKLPAASLWRAAGVACAVGLGTISLAMLIGRM